MGLAQSRCFRGCSRTKSCSMALMGGCSGGSSKLAGCGHANIRRPPRHRGELFVRKPHPDESSAPVVFNHGVGPSPCQSGAPLKGTRSLTPLPLTPATSRTGLIEASHKWRPATLGIGVAPLLRQPGLAVMIQ